MMNPAHPPALVVDSVRKSFGTTHALRGVSLTVAAGEVHALIGENGAGKSTLMKILSGAHAPDGGTMELDGRPYRPATPHDARLTGVAMIYQELNLALHLPAWENIVLGSESVRAGWIDRRASRGRARAALAQLGHETLDLDRPAGAFGVAEQQVIEIARALLVRPRVLILDEPTSSLTPADAARLFDVLARLRAQGVAVIYISHFLEECRRIADRFTVLKDGETAGTGPMADTPLERIVKLMTGREVKDLYARTDHAPGEVVLEAEELRTGPRLRRASVRLQAGEILGLAGLIGAGRTELVRAVFGLDRLASGAVRIAGAPPGRATPRDRWAQGVGFVSEDRKEEGLMLARPVADNLTATKFAALGRWGWIHPSRQGAAARRWINELAIRCRDGAQPVGELSGGNQQKVAIARLLEHPARILLLDEPTRGIDVGSKAQIYPLIGRLAAEGRAVIVVSSYLPELLGLCDRIGVMCRGELVAVRPRSEWNEAEIMRVATGSGEAAAAEPRGT
jgi:ribose transport system ATP-binding protein